MNSRGRHVLSGVLAGAVLVGTLAGCGDAEAGKRRYIAEVEAVCAAAGQETDPERHPVESAADQVTELERAASAMGTAARRIQAIEPPPADAERVKTGFIAPAGRLAARIDGYARQAKAALAARNQAEVDRIVAASLDPDQDEKAMRAFARAYGFTLCAGEEPGQPPSENLNGVADPS
ncbi:hypothetical protein [Rhizohabitans arisaemae]|uniref:hypothetical protein n=1 Tax=Rhizohabitans arisaemae TaxID=2720610 RepID=UPI0024B13253|nr:hypothetical protein [Rhizohabitans arisaemae]